MMKLDRHVAASCFFLVVSMAAQSVRTQAAPAADVFDKPLHVQTKRLPADPAYPKQKHMASCFSYPGYMIKQLDFGEVGAERLSIIPLAAGATVPCVEAKAANERVIPPEIWSGYFAGVKGAYAFFNADDGINGALGFMVVRMEDGKKMIDDVKEKDFHSIELHDGVPVLRYRRQYAASCSVPTQGASCVDEIVHATGVGKASLAQCVQGYRNAAEALARERCKTQLKITGNCVADELALIHKQKWDASPSVVSYEVELDLHETASAGQALPMAQIKPSGDVSACRPAD